MAVLNVAALVTHHELDLGVVGFYVDRNLEMIPGAVGLRGGLLVEGPAEVRLILGFVRPEFECATPRSLVAVFRAPDDALLAMPELCQVCVGKNIGCLP